MVDRNESLEFGIYAFKMRKQLELISIESKHFLWIKVIEHTYQYMTIVAIRVPYL